MAQISLENISFYAYHGCFEEEQRVGNDFLVSLAMKVNTTAAAQSDDLSQTVNYQEVFEVVKQQMEITSKLLEHVTQRIIDAVLQRFPAIDEITVSVSKINPPLGGQVEKVTVTMDGKQTD